MKRVMLWLLLLLPMCAIHAQTDQRVIDSLQQVAYSLPHDTTRLFLLKNITISEQYSTNFIKRAEELLQEAKMQDQHSYMCDAAYYHALYYYNYTEEHDSIAKWVSYIQPIAEKIGYWSCYYNAQKLLINSFIYNEDYEFALNEAEKMQQKAKETSNISGLVSSYLCMANAFSETNRIKRMQESILEAYKYMPQIKPIDLKMDIYEQLIEHYADIGEYDLLHRYLDEYLEALTSSIQGSITLENAYPSHFFYINVYYIKYYVGIGDLESARKQIEKTQAEFNENIFKPYGILLHEACARYQLALRNYQTAINHTDSALNIEQEYGVSYRIRIELLRLKADILTEKGSYNNALTIYEKSKQLRDSLNKAISERQFTQIKELYNLEKLQEEQLRLRRVISTTMLIIIFIILIISTLYMSRMRRINKRLRYSEKETKEATERTEKANEEKSHFLSNMSHAIRVPLNSVVGFSQLLVSDEELSEEERNEYAEITQTESDKLMRLVNNVLDLSRLEAKMTKWKLEDVDIVQLCNDAVSSVRMQTNQVRILYECDAPSTIIHTDTSRLIQVICTMLYNNFCPDKDVRVVYFSVYKRDNFIEFFVVNSPLLDANHASEEVNMQHRINELLLQYFHGEYEIMADATAGPTIRFTYPLKEK